MPNKLAEGDTVKLDIDNSPNMSIEKVEGKCATCIWFDKNQRFNKEEFLLEDLVFIRKKDAKTGIGFGKNN
jgi:hypothetical protein